MSIELSVVVPVKDEAGNAVPLLMEICTALRGKVAFEAIFVDDFSKDATAAELLAARAEAPELRVLKHRNNCGQSRAIRTGVQFAQGRLVATLDGDGQNDPADIPALLQQWRATEGTTGRPLGLVAGQRRKRQDSFMKRFASRFGNGIRGWLLNDRTRDTGCGLKLFSREAFLRLPYFDHMHRFMAALMLREGYAVEFLEVNHRQRSAGRSKYTNLGRLAANMTDLWGVMWLRSRARLPGGTDEL